MNVIIRNYTKIVLIAGLPVLLNFIYSCDKKEQTGQSFKNIPLSDSITNVVEIPFKSDKMITLNLNKFKGSKLTFTDIVKDVNCIPLETNGKNSIGEIDKVQFYNGRYYILDKYKAKALFVFDSYGKFCYSIVKQGKGPLEFIEPYDFTINFDTNQIVIFDGMLSKVVSYDIEFGKPVKEEKVYYRFSNIAYTGDGLYCLSSKYDDNSHIKSINNNLLYFTDIKFRLEYICIRKDNSSKNDFFIRNDLNQNNVENFYSPRFQNSIYKIKDSIIEKIYNLNFDKIEVDKEIYNLEFSRFRELAKDKFFFMGKYLGGKNIDYFELSSMSKTICIYYDKKNELLVGGQDLLFMSKILPFYSDPIAVYEDKFITYIDAFSISNIKKNVKASELEQLPKHFKNIINNISSYDNPVIMTYKIDLSKYKNK